MTTDQVLPLKKTERMVIDQFDAVINEMINKKNGALQMLIRQNDLAGTWRYEDGNLICVDAQPTPVTAHQMSAPNGNSH